MAIRDMDRDSILRGLTPLERNPILLAKTPLERDAIVGGIENQYWSRYAILSGITHVQIDRDGIASGKNLLSRDCILDTKSQAELNCILDAVEPSESYIRYDFASDEITDLTITSGTLTNEITIRYAYDFAEGNPRAAITKHNPISKLIYGDAKNVLELKMIQHTRQAEKIADAILYTSSVPEVKCSFRHNLRSLFLEVGDVVSITHPAGVGENGWQKALAMVTRKRLIGVEIEYELTLKPSGNFYRSELVTLSQTSGAGKEGISISYEHGVATITIYADVQGYPPVEGAEVVIGGVKKITDRNGQVRFNLEPGTYTAYITASGYEDAEVTFTV